VPAQDWTIVFTDSVRRVEATLRARGDDGSADPWLERLDRRAGSAAPARPLGGQRPLVATAATAATDAPPLPLDGRRGVSTPRRSWADPVPARSRGRRLRNGRATHDVELAAAIATRVVMLGAGEVAC
jgi:hypothetical protein